MKELDKMENEILATQEKLIHQAKKAQQIHESFGQNELRRLEDKWCTGANAFDQDRWHLMNIFRDWCETFDLNELKLC
jgi:hypothetical protein